MKEVDQILEQNNFLRFKQIKRKNLQKLVEMKARVNGAAHTKNELMKVRQLKHQETMRSALLSH